IDE
ncbi:hypothetical protein D020_0430B, partial [Vibrio parahaemolyticus SBR10290]